MKILYLAFTNSNIDSRTRDLLLIAHHLGDVFYIGMSDSDSVSANEILIKSGHSKILNYIVFVYTVLKHIFSNQYDGLFIDNYHAAPCGLLIRKIYKNNVFVIQDVRELYLSNNLSTFFGKILIYCETMLMKRADIVISANAIRAQIYKGLHRLKKMPIVFENIHWFDNQTKSELSLLNNETIKVVVTDGLNPQRMTRELLEAINYLDGRFSFFVVGDVSDEEIKMAESLVSHEKIKQISFVGKMPHKELGQFLLSCDIGVVKYNFDDLNNIFCASGKIYEFIMSGLPVVTTEQAVLKGMCEKYGIGVADNKFYPGLLKIADNMSIYKENAKKYQSEIIKRDYVQECVQKIKEIMKEIHGSL